MQIILFDTIGSRNSLFPITVTRSIAAIQIGMLTMCERWQRLTDSSVSILTEDYLAEDLIKADTDLLYVDASIVPDKKLFEAIIQLKDNHGIKCNNSIIALKCTQHYSFGFSTDDCKNIEFTQWPNEIKQLQYGFDIFKLNDELLRLDFEVLTRNRTSQDIPSSNAIINANQIFIEEGAVVEHSILNAATGPIYIGKDVLIMEGSMIRGSFAALEKSVVKMGSKIYSATTVGKNCTVGGEIKNTLFFNNSNKAHDGYLGDAVIGAWCNLGAGTSCSNIKNTAGEVKIWNPQLHQWINAGTKCGVLIGDYSRTAINTSLNTGTVVGVCCNIVQPDFPPKFIEHFTWNTSTKEKYILDKAFKDIDSWKQLKQKTITEKEKNILSYIYNKQT